MLPTNQSIIVNYHKSLLLGVTCLFLIPYTETLSFIVTDDIERQFSPLDLFAEIKFICHPPSSPSQICVAATTLRW